MKWKDKLIDAVFLRSRLPIELAGSAHDERYDAYLIISNNLEVDLKKEGFCDHLLDDLLLLKQVRLVLRLVSKKQIQTKNLI